MIEEMIYTEWIDKDNLKSKEIYFLIVYQLVTVILIIYLQYIRII